MLDAAVAVIEELSSTFEPERYTDDYEQRLEQLVARKRRGEGDRGSGRGAKGGSHSGG